MHQAILLKLINNLRIAGMAHQDFVEIIDSLTHLNAQCVDISFHSDYDCFDHYLTVGSPTLKQQFKRFIALTHDKTQKYQIRCVRYTSLSRPTDTEINIELDVLPRLEDNYENIAFITLQGDPTFLIDNAVLEKATEFWLNNHNLYNIPIKND